MTDLTVVFTNCEMQRGAITREAGVAMELWATYSDLMLTGQELGVDIPGAAPGAHIINVTVRLADADIEEGSPYVIAAFTLACEHDFPINKEERVRSRLLGPQPPRHSQQILIPKGGLL